MINRIYLQISFIFILLSITTLAQTYYVTETGKKFHKKSCRFVQMGAISIEIKDAIAKEYEPCGVCKPGGEMLAREYYHWKAQQDGIDKVNGEKTKVEKKRCKANTNEGKRCKRNAKEDSDYCWQHKKK